MASLNILRTATVTASLAAIGDAIPLGGNLHWISVEVGTTGAALTDFGIYVQPKPGGNMIARWSGADWSDASNFSPDSWVGTSDTSGDPVNTLSDGEYLELMLWVGPVHAMQFYATDGAGTAVITIQGVAYGRIR